MPQKLRPSYKFNEEQLDQLKQIVPEAFKDGMLDINSLYDALSDYNEEDSLDMDDNFYGLYWPGKRQAKRAASIPPKGTLVPVKGDGVDQENTKNIYIEGDNLEVLKLLQKSYAGKIKMIYIDPPYNTGNDFVYKDDFSEMTEEYEKETGDRDEQGVKQAAKLNSRADGRFHSKWLTMMYPRLKLAHRLLSEDGVIFISIDDNEVAQLRKICDEIFGEDNFIGQFIWKSRQNKDNRNLTGVSIDHEYVISYIKGGEYRALHGSERKESQYTNPDNDPRGLWTSANMVGILPEKLRPNCHYELINPNTGINYGKPQMGWRYDKKTMNKLIEDNRILWPENIKGRPRKKSFLSDISDILPGYSSIIGVDVYTRNGTKEIEEIFQSRYFDYPKPIALLKDFINQTTNKTYNSIILDFFSGSSTTAHAVMQLNAEDGGNRQFIMVQLDEIVTEKNNKEAYDFLLKEKKPLNICEIGKERIRRAGRKIKEGAGLNASNLDTGFKVFRSASSNYKKWQNYKGTDIKEAEDLFLKYENPLIESWKEEDLLTEIMLTEGFPLDSAVAVIKDFKKNKITKISSDFCEHSLFICLDNTIKSETINTLILSAHDIFICLDNAVTDQDKVRLDDKGLIKTI